MRPTVIISAGDSRIPSCYFQKVRKHALFTNLLCLITRNSNHCNIKDLSATIKDLATNPASQATNPTLCQSRAAAAGRPPRLKRVGRMRRPTVQSNPGAHLPPVPGQSRTFQRLFGFQMFIISFIAWNISIPIRKKE